MRNFIHRIMGETRIILFRCYAELERSNFKFRKFSAYVVENRGVSSDNALLAYLKSVYIMRTEYTRNISWVSPYKTTADI